ncbi:hypothetical protein ABH935_005679 [Catenulispora sp. GAS73]|uniref:hypothetical protein n=1 Tax=Catenulispora sp. GAS73 TaxID=3156269 RepID=UPI0035110557
MSKLILTPGLWIRLRIIGTGIGDVEADSHKADDTEIIGAVESAVGEDGEFTNDWAVTPTGRFAAARPATSGATAATAFCGELTSIRQSQ